MENLVEFSEFLKNEVDVNPARLQRLHSGIRGITEHLSQNLTGYEWHQPQGSYGLNTIIRPVGQNGYDVDVIFCMRARGNEKPSYYLAEICNSLMQNSNYSNKVTAKTRSVLVDFAGDFSLDVVPCVKRRGTLRVCNKKDNQFELTDGTGYTEWFNTKADITSSHLKGAVKLLKYLRDHKDNFEVPSIILTTIVGHSVHSNEPLSKFSSVSLTLKLVSNRINSCLQATPNRPRFRNPALRQERFNRHWDQNDFRNFKEKFNIYNTKINAAYTETDPQESIRKWRDLFGENFGR